MATFREQKRQARQQLHTALSEPAIYFPAIGDEGVPVTVRLHLRFDALGELLSLQAGFADRQELTPRIIFLGAQVAPVRNAYVVTKDMGAFRVDTPAAADDITIAADVATVSKDKAIGFGWDPTQPYMGLPAPVIGG